MEKQQFILCHIIENKANTKDENSNVISKNKGLRLPIGPSKLKEPETKR